MVRKRQYKYTCTHGHPDLLFDMLSDPNELTNLANRSDCAEILADLKAIAFTNWNPDTLGLQIKASQKQRKVIKTTPGASDKWDYVARVGDDTRFVRVDGVDATKARLRLPQVPEVPTQWPALDTKVIASVIAGRSNLSDYLPDFKERETNGPIHTKPRKPN